MKRGRPVGSNVRQNMIEILYFLGSAHGYHIYKVYRQIFPKITLRAIYYHLKKGIELQELEVDEIKKSQGIILGEAKQKKFIINLEKRQKQK